VSENRSKSSRDQGAIDVVTRVTNSKRKRSIETERFDETDEFFRTP